MTHEDKIREKRAIATMKWRKKNPKKTRQSQYKSYAKNYIMKVLGQNKNKKTGLKGLKQVQQWINNRKHKLN